MNWKAVKQQAVGSRLEQLPVAGFQLPVSVDAIKDLSQTCGVTQIYWQPATGNR